MRRSFLKIVIKVILGADGFFGEGSFVGIALCYIELSCLGVVFKLELNKFQNLFFEFLVLYRKSHFDPVAEVPCHPVC